MRGDETYGSSRSGGPEDGKIQKCVVTDQDDHQGSNYLILFIISGGKTVGCRIFKF